MLDWLLNPCKELRVQIANLNTANKNLNDTIIKVNAEKNDLVDQNNSLNTIITKTNELLKQYVPPEPPVALTPSWLDIKESSYKPSIRIDEKGKTYHIEIASQDIYCVSPSLIKLVKDQGFLVQNYETKIRMIWKYVLERSDYRYDADESWEYPTTTYYRMYGDCEDTTILFVTLCRLSGIPADKVYNAIGWFKTSDGTLVGHSYPVVELSDKLFYIFETTLSNYNDNLQPKLFKGSNYTADWGLSNWQFAGKIIGGNQI